GGAGHVLKLADRVLVGVLGVDGLAGAEAEATAGYRHVLVAPADEMHLDAPVAGVIDGLVPEGVEIERAADLTIDAGQQVEVESSGDAGGIVVGKHQLARVLLEVDADDQPAGQRDRPVGRPDARNRRSRVARRGSESGRRGADWRRSARSAKRR